MDAISRPTGGGVQCEPDNSERARDAARVELIVRRVVQSCVLIYYTTCLVFPINDLPQRAISILSDQQVLAC